MGINIVYALLVLVVCMVWVWSTYLQKELTVNSVTLRVGDSLSWVLASVVGIGVGAIVLSNALSIQGWKIFLFLICMMAVNSVVMWLTAVWVHAIASHKISERYRVNIKKRETFRFILVSLLSGSLVVSILLMPVLEGVVMVFLLTPIIVILERVVSLKIGVKELSKFDVYTEEEIARAEERLKVAIQEGNVLKPKENALKKIIKKEKARHKRLREQEKMSKASDNMVNIKRKNDTEKNESVHKGDDK